jgi:2-keto-3-deoxy-L-fuconate dehydrogenase
MMEIFSLKNKTAIVTGGGSGIGKAIAELFAKCGAHVFIFDLNEQACTETASALVRAGSKASAMTCDVTNEKSVMSAFEKVVAQQTKIDILVNSAGIAQIGNIENTSTDDLDKIYNINIKGTFHCMKYAVATMKQSGGVILNMASIAATIGIKDRFAYSMTKGAVLSMTLSVAKDYIGHNIRCNCVSPARVHTPFVDGFLKKNYPGKEEEMFEKLSASQPIGRMAKPDEIASLALYLCSDESSFVTGCDYPIDGGFTRLNN